MDSNNQPLDLLQKEESLPSSSLTIRSAGAGIVSMIIAFVAIVSLTNMDERPVLVVLALLLIPVLGLIIPVWMFVRSVRFLLKKQNFGAPKRSVAILLTGFLGFILLLLLGAIVLYIRADRQPPF
jgi:hypothetical protein